MKKYYLHNGTEQDGPFDISDLKSKGITAKTEVWYEGISDWTNADEIDELKGLFSKVTPPPIRPKSTTKDPIKKKNKLGRNLQFLGLILLLAFIGFTVVPNLLNNNENPKSYIEQKMTIEETENSDPLRFLSVEGNYNESFWGTEFKLKGKVTNRATIADYKDLVMRITYYSKTKSVIGTKDYTIYQVFQPNRVTSFKLDVENYKDVESIGLDVVGAITNN
ncbi:MAG: DUF4339 domain-containing protein [Polaribacter sp.]|nr:DUF4339 domain-containing protein [Polaribacter sp.]